MLPSTQVGVCRIIVAEYPKSGGSWVVSLLGDALGLPKRDIYVADGYSAFDIAKHPWYRGTRSWNVTAACVVKSHERPDSPLSQSLANESTATLHLIRDGRDVTVSKYFYERDFCVANGILPPLELPFDAYVEKTAAEWRAYVEAWSGRAGVVCRYEAFLADPARALARAIDQLGLPASREAVEQAVARNTKERFARSLDSTFRHNTFVRVATSGDWKNHFGVRDRAAFAGIAGDLLASLGYVRSSDVWE
jgi:Arc/MetJ family transcription regulator